MDHDLPHLVRRDRRVHCHERMCSTSCSGVGGPVNPYPYSGMLAYNSIQVRTGQVYNGVFTGWNGLVSLSRSSLFHLWPVDEEVNITFTIPYIVHR